MGAAPPTSEVHICNLALSRLGQPPINSIDVPQNKIEDRCAMHYPETRRELLRTLIPNFAKRLTILTADSTVIPEFGYSTAYRLPTDFIRLLALGNIALINGDIPPRLYELAEGYIYTNMGDEEGLDTTYIFDAKLVYKFDPLFAKALRLQLAMDMAYGFTLKATLVAQLESELEKALISAGAVAGQEKPPRRNERSKMRDIRRGGGMRRNTTLYP